MYPSPDSVLVEPTGDPGATAASALPVGAIARALKDVVEGAFFPMWIRGEICEFKPHRNGHWYFTLRDDTAQIRCVVWSRDQRRIPAAPDEGMQVAVHGQLGVYAARSDVQLTVRAIEAEGDGLWRKAVERTIARLTTDGLLAPDRKRPLPRLPRCVAVITSPSGAAVRDIVSVAQRRCASVRIVIVPATVQGELAPGEICRALELVARWGEADVVIVGRGGGGRDDLRAFDDERVARALAACPIPTISAVGHEIDVSVCDLVADLRAATPSAAAEAAVPSIGELRGELASLRSALCDSARYSAREARRRLGNTASTLASRATRTAERRRASMRELAGRMHALSPLATLARGYSVARDEQGNTLSSVQRFAPGQPFQLMLNDGRVRATTTAVEPSGKREQ